MKSRKERRKNFTLKSLPEFERPREKLINKGANFLPNSELLGIVISEGTQNQTAVDLAKEIFKKFKNFRNIANVSIKELCEINGIGPAKAAKIKAALEIGKRLEEESVKPGTRISCSEDIFKHYNNSLRDEHQEYFIAILIDARSKIIKEEQIALGTLTKSIVHPREVSKPAIRESAYGMILVHNHPTGDPEPGFEDIQLTKRLLEVGKILGIRVIDHIIIGDGRFVSFLNEGLLEF